MGTFSTKALVLMVVGLPGACVLLAQDEKAPEKMKPEEKKSEPDPAKKAGEPADKSKPDAGREQPDATEMEAWMKLASANEHHKKLDVLAGAWNLVIKFADDPGSESKGTAEFKWVMDGRFLVETAKTDLGGTAFEWMGWHGYDNLKKQYVSVWVDNFGTAIDTMTGRYDEATKTLTYIGETDDPAHGGKQTVKWSMTLIGKDKFTTRMIEGVGNGKEKVVMEITATRK